MCRRNKVPDWARQLHLEMWADCYDLAVEIDRRVAKFHPAPADCHPDPTTARLMVIAEDSYRPQDVDMLAALSTDLLGFAADINNLLLPELVVYLPKPCPICDTEWVKRRDKSGEIVNTRALSIRGDNGACCAHCRTRWQTIGELAILGRMIGYGSQVVIAE